MSHGRDFYPTTIQTTRQESHPVRIEMRCFRKNGTVVLAVFEEPVLTVEVDIESVDSQPAIGLQWPDEVVGIRHIISSTDYTLSMDTQEEE